MVSTDAPPSSLSQRIALFLSVLFSPFVCVPVFCVVYSQATARTHHEFLVCSFLCVAYSIGVPLLYIAWHVYHGHITDMHVKELDQRKGPFRVGFVAMGLQALTLYWIGAPQKLINLSLVMFGQCALFMLISRRWKISMHTGVLAACLAGCIELAHWNPLCLLLLGPLAWARKVRGRHEVSQGLVGALVGFALTWFPLRWLNG